MVLQYPNQEYCYTLYVSIDSRFLFYDFGLFPLINICGILPRICSMETRLNYQHSTTTTIIISKALYPAMLGSVI